MIAQDTGSAIVGPARADIFWGAGDRGGTCRWARPSSCYLRYAGAPGSRPCRSWDAHASSPGKALTHRRSQCNTSLPASLVQARRLSQADEFGRNLRPQSRQQSGCSETSGPDRNSMFGRPEPNRHGQSTIPIIAGVDCRPRAKPPHTNEVANRVFSGFSGLQRDASKYYEVQLSR